MPDPAAVERQFRLLQKEAADIYEQDLKRQQEQQARWTQARRRTAEKEHEIMRAIGIGPERLAESDRDDEAGLQEYLREVRPPLIDRLTQQASDTKTLALNPALQIPKAKITSVYATSLMAHDHSALAGNPGEQGNPYVLPWNPSQIKIKEAFTGIGSGLCVDFGGPKLVTFPLVADVWYVFTPDQIGWWNIVAGFSFHGFIILWVNRHFWDCKSAAVSLKVEMSVYQYAWVTDKSFDLIDINANYSINQFQPYDQFLNFACQAPLKPDDQFPVFVRVRVSIQASPFGDGSYAEINFADGMANFIQPSLMITWQ
jgi:hypothetical protein